MEAGKTLENNPDAWSPYGNYAMFISALYGTYALDSIYFETALKHHAVLVTLDDKDFLQRIKGRVGIEVCHPKEFS
jgi:rRNA-processing protein FCF1